MNAGSRFYTGLDAVKTELPLFPSDVGPDDVHLDAAIDWLRRSQDVTDNGGSAATYNLLLGWEDAYPETTGYIVPTLLSYAAAADDPTAADRALGMAEWLCTIQRPDGSFPGGTGTTGDPNVFNTGQIVFGLVAAARETGGERYREAARNACDWLVAQQADDGSWTRYDYGDQAHAYSTRIAWSLLEGATIVPERRDDYREAARRNLEWAVGLQRSNGWFEQASFERGGTPYLHTIAYTVRGLLEGGLELEDPAFVDAATRTADRLLSIQHSDGVLKGAYDASLSPAWYYCLTGNAQMAVIWLRLFEHTGEREYRLAARQAIEFLKRRQTLTGPEPIRGGLAGSSPIVGSYMYLRYPNWAAKFLADALLLAGDLEVTHSARSDSSAPSDPLRVCLLCDGDTVQRWIAEAIAEMVTRTNAELSLVVVNEEAGLFGPENVKRGKKYPAYAGYWIAARLLDRFRTDTAYREPVDIDELPGFADARVVRTYPTNVDGLRSELPAEVVDEIGSTSDLVVQCGFGPLKGDVLSATEHGVLSYHHGDPRAYRGGLAGFWEYVHDEPTAGMMVQLLNEDIDAGTVLAYDEVDISACTSWGDVRGELYRNSTGLLTSAVENVRSGPVDRLEVAEPGPVYTPPSAVQLAKYSVGRLLDTF